MFRILEEKHIFEIIRGHRIYEVNNEYCIQLPYDTSQKLANLLCSFWINNKKFKGDLSRNCIIINLSKVLPNVLLNAEKLFRIQQQEDKKSKT